MNARPVKPVYYFDTIHIMNWWLAFALSFFAEVAFWRSKLPQSRLRRFRSLDFASHQQWLQLMEDAFLRAQPRVRQFSHELSGEYKTTVLQQLLVEFEQYIFFVELGRSDAGVQGEVTPRLVLSCHGMLYQAQLDDQSQQIQPSKWTLLNVPLDFLALKTRMFLSHIKTCLLVLRLVFRPRQSFPEGLIVVDGVNPTEIPNGENQLDFAWMSKEEERDPKRFCYLLPRKPSELTAYYLVKSEMALLVGRVERLKLCGGQLLQALAMLRCQNLKKLLLSNASAKTCIFQKTVLEIMKPKAYLASFAAGWPDLPEIAACRMAKVHTIMWMYGGGEFYYSSVDSRFKDLGLRYSVCTAEEFWVWNDAVKDLFSSRQLLDSNDQPRFTVTGPIMCGQRRWLQGPSRENARQHLGISSNDNSFLISFFDIPVINMAVKRGLGLGPYAHHELREALFEGAMAIMNTFPQVKIIIKPKRDLDSKTYVPCQALEHLLNPQASWNQQGRVLVLSWQIDPFLPIAAADFNLGTPYTSPVMACFAGGGVGAYYDPLGLAKFTYKNIFDSVTIRSEQELLNKISSLIAEAKKERGKHFTLNPSLQSVDPKVFDGHARNLIENTTQCR